MTMETYQEAIKLAEELGETISIGGGEPTLHPQFWVFLGIALGADVEEGFVWLATNGSQTKTALALARMAKKGILGVALSQDIYHDPIDPAVVRAFTKDKREYGGYDNQTPDAREIRNVTGKEVKAGRCKHGEKSCCCPELNIIPSGDIKICGCKKSPVIGNVHDGTISLPPGFEHGRCYKDIDNGKDT